MMTLLGAAVVLLVGIGVGLLSGLVGIGGGIVMVPFLYAFYAHPEWFGVSVPGAVVVAVAHATSLFVIVPTSIRGAITFHGAGLVVWPAVWAIAPASVVAAFVTARIAPALPGELLQLAFGLVLLASAVRMLKPRRLPASGESPPPRRRLHPGITLPVGVAVGVFSALLGVGGGIVAIPLLVHLVGLQLREVAATSMGIIAVTATAGTVGYMAGGGGAVPGMPWGSIGYVHVISGVIMFATSVVAVSWGARLNQRLPARKLALLFGSVFALIGVDLVARNAGGVLGLW
jgi:uncharacterized protein